MLCKAIIGIDLGTTNTTCSILLINEDGKKGLFKLPIKQACFEKNEEVKYITKEGIIPSCVIVSETSNMVYCGSIPPQNQSLNFFPIRNIKSKLADDLWKVKVNNKFLTPTCISAIILFTVLENIKSFEGNSDFIFNIDSIESIIITIPATFSAKMRRATIDAAILAGFSEKQISLLDEPVAAIMSGYNFNTLQFKDFIPDNEHLLVYDIGGGTVDVTVVQINMQKKSIEIKATSRYNELGGADIDLEIASFLLTKIKDIPKFNSYIDKITNDKTLARAFANNLIDMASSLKFEINLKIKDLKLPPYKMDELKMRKDLPQFSLNMDEVFGIGSDAININLLDIIEVLERYISVEFKKNARNIFKPLDQVWSQVGGLQRNNYVVGGMSQFSLVALELGKQLNPMNMDLDATYSISEGAVKYAYLKQNQQWKIIETTNEKVFLRRSGMLPLEILPSNLTIPSEDIPPPNILENNDTIQWNAGTDCIQLEFFQGISADDIGLSLINNITIQLDEPILTTGKITMIKGRINSNKQFIFHIQISEQDELICDKIIKFDKTFKSYNGESQSSKLSGLIINSSIYE